MDAYQGYMELQALAPFRGVGHAEFDEQAMQDFAGLCARLQAQFGASRSKGVVVFPGGTAHQVMPPRWAADHLRDATFAFHATDPYAQKFSAEGLRVGRFENPEEMLKLGQGASMILVTDSFPSHVWQLMGKRVILLLSQQPRSRVVHPGFPDEQVVESCAPCCPCRSRDRGNHRLCDAGHAHCATWFSEDYVSAFHRVLASPQQ